jgi:ubiquinone/menaquinone biosynthesis C-methylase UbiE
MDIHAIFRQRLLSLGELAHDRNLEGIWVPADLTADEVDGCIHAIFRENAGEYVRAYQATHHFEILLRKAFEKSGFDRFDEPIRILDICSGAGNSVIPLLAIFPKAEVIASDLSVELLAMLRQYLASQGTADRCTLVQMNAERLDLADGTVDLVVGVAALHHLFRPDLTIASCARILRDGGLAVFFEPFEVGFVYMKLLYQQILSDPRAKALEPDVQKLLGDLLTDINRRLGEDKSDPLYQQIDDKWLFTTSYLREHSRRHGFKLCTTYSLLSGKRDFAEKMEVVLKAGANRKADALPDWAWELVRAHDRCLSTGGHLDCIYEGGILLQK